MKAAHARGKATLPWNILGLLVFVVMIFPVYWMFASAFQPTDQLNKLKPSFFPCTRRSSTSRMRWTVRTSGARLRTA